ncbi:MFS transporter [Actinacidiphila sp. bgisy167]|uniref:MFS transporter n=1 Tax=Actinacidiphila sp. bgisy167 TaxID=3413797 RepID=UPI003D73A396
MALIPRAAVLRERDFRRFFLGYSTSLLGSSMASVALAFAVLETGGGGTELGLVLAARILPLVLVLLAGGVLTDRWGSRSTMLAADVTRCLTQAGLALALIGGAAHMATLIALVVVWGAAEALFTPALDALVPRIVPDDKLADGNALLGMARSAASIAGPALAGVLTATAGASAVLTVDALSYGVSVVALLLLPRTVRTAGSASSFVRELREGWTEFRSRTWLWITSVHVGLFNLLVWAPFLVLGPLVVQRDLGGPSSWGLVMALYGAGAVVGGTVMLGRRPRRPLLLGTAATSGWAMPSAALAAGLPLPWICAAALAAGVGSAVCGTLYATVTQSQVPVGALARVSAYGTFGAFALGPVGLAAAGPSAVLVGTAGVLGFGAVWQLAAVAVVLTLPAVRSAFPLPGTTEPAAAPDAAGSREPSTTSPSS